MTFLYFSDNCATLLGFIMSWQAETLHGCRCDAFLMEQFQLEKYLTHILLYSFTGVRV